MGKILDEKLIDLNSRKEHRIFTSMENSNLEDREEDGRII
jgi:hypothetical protein